MQGAGLPLLGDDPAQLLLDDVGVAVRFRLQHARDDPATHGRRKALEVLQHQELDARPDVRRHQQAEDQLAPDIVAQVAGLGQFEEFLHESPRRDDALDLCAQVLPQRRRVLRARLHDVARRMPPHMSDGVRREGIVFDQADRALHQGMLGRFPDHFEQARHQGRAVGQWAEPRRRGHGHRRLGVPRRQHRQRQRVLEIVKIQIVVDQMFGDQDAAVLAGNADRRPVPVMLLDPDCRLDTVLGNAETIARLLAFPHRRPTTCSSSANTVPSPG